ncbi:hypothetical protein WMY93_016006 [Mugilogobius chulae]|uniref:Uncharacterized protein n=1 Tax=Mugilogobius chulae TaxID=88201 RepID=A0AAW0P1U7_9GOBI
MDVHRAAHHNRMEYNLDNMDGKMAGKMMPCQEDRLDSGVDSLREEELVNELKDFHVTDNTEFTQEYEPWRAVVTDDGDTLLHLAIIHEATEHVLEMIKLSHNHPFLNVQNHQRQTALHLAVITEQPSSWRD